MSTYDVLNPANETIVRTIELHDVASVDQVIDRGERYPYVFSHVSPDAAFKAPHDAEYVQVCTASGPASHWQK